MSQQSNGWYWIGILALVAGLTWYASEKNLVGVYHEYQQSEIELQNLDQDVLRLELKRDGLERKVQGLGTDSDSLTVETTIRQKTGHVKKGETIYRVELPETK